jgi:hypothetical protein
MNKSNGSSAFLRGIRPYGFTAAAIIAAYVLFALVLGAGEEVVRILMLAGLAVCLLIALIRLLSRENLSKTETLIVILIAAGIVMRVGYMLYTSFRVRGHDIGAYDQTGHFAYMYKLFTSGTLPQSNEYQFYHPPFAHNRAGACRQGVLVVPARADVDSLFEAAKLVPCFASCAVLWVCRSLCRELKLSPRAAALSLAVLAFHPTFYIFSSSVNNDPLMLLFFMIAVLYTIRWYSAPTMKNILLIALSIGLGMMTKLSAASVAFFTAPVFLAVFVKAVRERRGTPILGQFVAFAAVCAPLGLWYPVRNYIRFGQAFGHVYTLSAESKLYSGDYTFVQRFLSFPTDQILNPLYCQPYGDYNLWLYTLKCSVFGEFSFKQAESLAKLLIAANLILIVISLLAMAYVMLRGRGLSNFARFGLFSLWLIQIVSFIVFNVGYPFGCTMDFRYIVPTASTGAIYTGIALDRLKEMRKTAAAVLFGIGVAAVALFGIASVLFYAA